METLKINYRAKVGRWIKRANNFFMKATHFLKPWRNKAFECFFCFQALRFEAIRNTALLLADCKRKVTIVIFISYDIHIYYIYLYICVYKHIKCALRCLKDWWTEDPSDTKGIYRRQTPSSSDARKCFFFSHPRLSAICQNWISDGTTRSAL